MTPIYHSVVSLDGKRQCVVESDADSVWAYLLDLSSRQIVSDVPVCSLRPLKKLSQFRAEVSGTDTPPLVEEYSTPRAIVTGLTVDRVAVRWLSDGKSAVILVDDEPFALMRLGEERGYSKATKKDGPWGKPWDEGLYQKAEAQQSPDPTRFARGSPLSVRQPAH